MTVKVWFVRDGPHPTGGGSAYELPLELCIEHLGLQKRQWLTDKRKNVRFADERPDLTVIAGYKHVVCEIDKVEAKASGWRVGFYTTNLKPAEAISRLGPPLEELSGDR